MGGICGRPNWGALLTANIFGVDIDEDACQIADLSLALTLLVYIDPPDLTKTISTQLLRGYALDNSIDITRGPRGKYFPRYHCVSRAEHNEQSSGNKKTWR